MSFSRIAPLWHRKHNMPGTQACSGGCSPSTSTGPDCHVVWKEVTWGRSQHGAQLYTGGLCSVLFITWGMEVRGLFLIFVFVLLWNRFILLEKLETTQRTYQWSSARSAHCFTHATICCFSELPEAGTERPCFSTLHHFKGYFLRTGHCLHLLCNHRVVMRFRRLNPDKIL